MKILVDFKNSRGNVIIIKLDNGEVWKLHGECNRCGMCCDVYKMLIPEFSNGSGGCNKLYYENVDGKKLASCEILWSRPAGCLLYPRDPYEELPEKCSFTWEKVSG
jgi:hypothetical protein